MSQMRIFLSHNHTDIAFSDALAKALRDAGADVWYDEQNLGAGHLLARSFPTNLKNALSSLSCSRKRHSVRTL